MDTKSLEQLETADVFRLAINNRIRGVSIMLEELSNDQLIQMLREDKCDFGVCSTLPVQPTDVMYTIDVHVTVKRVK